MEAHLLHPLHRRSSARASLPSCSRSIDAQAGYPLDGVDLSPLLSDAGWSPERTLYWRMKHREQAACVAGRWKYLRIEGHEYLFDVVADGRERATLAKRDPHRLATLRRKWQEWNETIPAIPDDAQVHLFWNERDMPRPTH